MIKIDSRMLSALLVEAMSEIYVLEGINAAELLIPEVVGSRPAVSRLRNGLRKDECEYLHALRVLIARLPSARRMDYERRLGSILLDCV